MNITSDAKKNFAANFENKGAYKRSSRLQIKLPTDQESAEALGASSFFLGSGLGADSDFDLDLALALLLVLDALLDLDFDLLDLADDFLALSALLPDAPESSSASRDFT